MDNYLILLLIAVIIFLIAYILGRSHRSKTELPTDMIDLYKGVQDLPSRVLSVVQGSINPQKGRMAELLTYAELRYDYDRIIPLGQPIDFIGIKNNQRIDFIEIKSGLNATLSEEEKHIKKLVASGMVNFRLIRITDQEINQFIDATS